MDPYCGNVHDHLLQNDLILARSWADNDSNPELSIVIDKLLLKYQALIPF